MAIVEEGTGATAQEPAGGAGARDRAVRSQRLHEALDQLAREVSAAPDLDVLAPIVAKLPVPWLADWCLLSLTTGTLRREGVERLQAAAFCHRSPALADRLAPAIARAPLTGSVDLGPARAFRSGETQLLDGVSEERLGALGPEPEGRAAWRQLGIVALLAVPLVHGGRRVGVLTFGSGTGGPPIDETARRLAEDYALRAAAALAHARLLRELARAERPASLRHELVAGVSHDLKNPLSAILMASSMLIKQAANDATGRVLKHAEAIQRSARKMERIVSELHDLANLEAGRLRLSLRPHEIGPLVQQALQSVEPIAAKKPLALSGELPAPTSQVYGDRDRLVQVLACLLLSATRVTPAHGEVRLRAEPRDGEIWFSVSDGGPGIPADELPHLFEGPLTRRTARDPNGLGLTLARGLVDAHGGRIWAEARGETGMTIFVALPAAHAAVLVPAPTIATPGPVTLP